MNAAWFVHIGAGLALLLSISAAGYAEELKVVTWRGHQALRLTGDIGEGTAKRFEAAIAGIAPSPHGARILLLDSPGGLVGEAFAMSAVMDKVPVHTVIPNGATCASACASIVFIAGKFRTVEPFGVMGQHSCSLDGVPDRKCNDALSEHAVQHGVDYGAVSAFVTFASPQEVIWLDRESVDGWEISRYPGSDESNYEHSPSPLYMKATVGREPAAQSAWRIDFREDGYQAFLRPVSDNVRDGQLNLFCDASLKGRLFLGMEMKGPKEKVMEAVKGVVVKLDAESWTTATPTIWQEDDKVSEVITEVPTAHIRDFLTNSSSLAVEVAMDPKKYKPIVVTTRLDGSRKNLLFAADHCVSGHYGEPRPPLNEAAE